MAKQEYTKYQQKIINRYYDNLDTMMLQKLQELVTELYLAGTDKEKIKLWDRVHKAMVQLKIPPEVISKIMTNPKVEILASHLEQWLRKK
jgi:uncharacterized protein YaaW (UPF0174 family)